MNKISSWRRKCDKLWTEIILIINPLCEITGEPATQAHHFVPKSLSAALRYDLKNGVSLITKIHFAHHAKGDPAIHSNIIQVRGKKWIEYIEKNRRKIIKISLGYYKEQYDRLQNIKTNMQKL